jgi:anthranilate synthase component 2
MSDRKMSEEQERKELPSHLERSVVLLIDNYDSFVFNLSRYLRELGCETLVVRNDETTVAAVAALRPEAIVISPGPCAPDSAGVSIDLVRRLGATMPILGVCLGHQAIGAAYGGRIVRATEPVHGRTSRMTHDGSALFDGLPRTFEAARYHSLLVEEATLPADLVVTCRSDDGLVMGLAHRLLPVYGVQFHPESVLTQHGHRLLANFLRCAGIKPCGDPPREYAPPEPEDDFYHQPIAADAQRPL